MNHIDVEPRRRIRTRRRSWGLILLAVAFWGPVLLALTLWRHGGPAAVAADAGKPPMQYVYKTFGDRKLTLDFDYPPDWKPSDKRPAMVFFFGGGWSVGSPAHFKIQAQYFARRGMVCVRPDYRIRSKDGVQPKQCVEDARSAMRWIRAHSAQLGIDPNRMVASGGSAGGHLAACTFFADGIDDPADDSTVSPKPNAMVLYNPVLILDDTAADQPVSPAVIKQISPLLHVRKQMPPTLLLVGTKDCLCSQVRSFAGKGKALGAPVEVFYAEDQKHAFFNISPWLEKTTGVVDAFLSRINYLGREPKVPLPTRDQLPNFFGPGRDLVRK